MLFQDSSLVSLVVRKLLLNYISQPGMPFKSASYSIFYEGSEPSVLQRVGSAAGMVVLFDAHILSNLLLCAFNGSVADNRPNSIILCFVDLHFPQSFTFLCFFRI